MCIHAKQCQAKCRFSHAKIAQRLKIETHLNGSIQSCNAIRKTALKHQEPITKNQQRTRKAYQS